MATKPTVKGAPQKNAPAPAQTESKGEAGKTAKAVVVIPELNKKALSLDVGKQIVANFAAVFDLDENIVKMQAESVTKKHATLASMTQAIVKAANADDNIDLALVFSGEKENMEYLNNQLLMAMGIREAKNVAKDGKPEVWKYPYTAEVAAYFPSPKDDKDSDEYKRKNNLRSNFLAQLKRATQAAHGIIEEGIDVKMDKKTNTLMLSGKAVKKHFGQETVTLNEKQTITIGSGEKAQKVKLAAKPSFTEIASIGAAAENKSLKKRNAGGGTGGGTTGAGTGTIDADKAIIAMATEFVKALNLFKGVPSDAVKKSISDVANAAAVVMKRTA